MTAIDWISLLHPVLIILFVYPSIIKFGRGFDLGMLIVASPSLALGPILLAIYRREHLGERLAAYGAMAASLLTLYLQLTENALLLPLLSR